MVKPTKHSEHSSMKSGPHKVHTVSNHRLAASDHSKVFPQHVGRDGWHKGSRNGHPGSHTVTSKGRK